MANDSRVAATVVPLAVRDKFDCFNADDSHGLSKKRIVHL